jgi:hypothetical protein
LVAASLAAFDAVTRAAGAAALLATLAAAFPAALPALLALSPTMAAPTLPLMRLISPVTAARATFSPLSLVLCIAMHAITATAMTIRAANAATMTVFFEAICRPLLLDLSDSGDLMANADRWNLADIADTLGLVALGTLMIEADLYSLYFVHYDLLRPVLPPSRAQDYRRVLKTILDQAEATIISARSAGEDATIINASGCQAVVVWIEHEAEGLGRRLLGEPAAL